MVMEDAEAPHHMLLLRNFMSQGLFHKQPLLYASPSKDPKGFLGTLPSPRSCKDDKKSRDHDPEQVLCFFHLLHLFIYVFLTWLTKKFLFVFLYVLQEKGLRIAWQYKKYFGEHQQTFDNDRGNKLVNYSYFSFIFYLYFKYAIAANL